MGQIALTGLERPPSALPAPTSTGEYITLLSHYHRAEIARMAGWRDRIDLTTNWAITLVGAMLSLALSSPSAHHGIILLAMVLATLMLTIEARRYRFFDVFRARVRRLEREWYAPIFQCEPQNMQTWLAELGNDLQRPRFLISRSEALSRRLRRTYGWMYLILLGTWLFKTTSSRPLSERPVHSSSIQDWFDATAIGPVPGVLVVVSVFSFYAWLLYVGLRYRNTQSTILHGDVHL
jgi:uncharacterized membrane protein